MSFFDKDFDINKELEEIRNYSSFEDDICWCANSHKGMGINDYCDKVICFRHLSHRKPHSHPDVFTISCFKDTEDCPYFKGE